MLKEFRKLSASQSTFFCFTPLVALLTFFIEFGLAGYVLYRYKLTPFSRLAVGIFLMLGTFQLAEYGMCMWRNPQLWSKIGIAAITLLPVLSLHLVTMLTRKSTWTTIGYLVGGVMIAIIFLFPVPILPHCTGKFVILRSHDSFEWIFYSYYMFFVLAGVWMLIQSLRQHKGDRKQLLWMLLVYASFLIPTTLVYILIGFARTGVPSIMCGFAVFGALILVWKELPRYYTLKGAKKRKGRK